MNKKRRARIEKAMSQFEDLKTEIEEIMAEEEEVYDNIPESLQASPNGEKSQTAIDNLNQAVNDVEVCLAALQTAIE